MCAVAALLEGMDEPQLPIFVSLVYDSYEYSVLGCSRTTDWSKKKQLFSHSMILLCTWLPLKYPSSTKRAILWIIWWVNPSSHCPVSSLSSLTTRFGRITSRNLIWSFYISPYAISQNYISFSLTFTLDGINVIGGNVCFFMKPFT